MTIRVISPFGDIARGALVSGGLSGRSVSDSTERMRQSPLATLVPTGHDGGTAAVEAGYPGTDFSQHAAVSLAIFLSDTASGWFDASPLAMAVVVLAVLLSLTALLALAVLRMVFVQRQKLAEAEQVRQQQAAVMQAQLDAVPFPILIKDMSGPYRALNNACLHRLGIDPARAIGQTSLGLTEHRWLALAD